MPRISNFRRSLAREDGIALPAVLGLLGVTILVAGAAASDSQNATDLARVDRDSSGALQAADAGVDAAVSRLNRLDVTNSASPAKCVMPNATTGLLQVADYEAGNQWCPIVQGTLADGTAYRYRVSAETTATDGSGVVTVTRTVVAWGTDGRETRRVTADLSAITGSPLFGQYSVISLQELRLPNNVFIGGQRSNGFGGGARSNGNIVFDNSGKICGDATPGPGRTIVRNNQWATVVCPGGVTAPAPTPAVLSPINASVAAVNDNGRICGSTTGQVTVTGDPCTARDKINWNASQRRLDISNNATLTLGGNIYSFCYLKVDNSAKLIIAPRNPGTSVRIYIDSPQNCGSTPNPKGIFELVNNSSITNQNGASALQFYVAGNEADPASSRINLNNSASSELPMTIYAPFSVVSIKNNVTIRGAVAAWKVEMDNQATVLFDQSVAALQTSTGVYPLLRRQRYRECTAAGGGAPPYDAGC